jgi:hypothetical protein
MLGFNGEFDALVREHYPRLGAFAYRYLGSRAAAEDAVQEVLLKGDTCGLSADPDGVFHAAWINSVNYVMQLWYSQIRVDRKRLLAALGDRPRSAARDVSELVELRFDDAVIDWPARRIDVPVRIANPSAVPVRGPFTLVIERDVPKFRAANADNKRTGAEAAWDFETKGGPVLAPGAQSDRVVLSWNYTGNGDAGGFLREFWPTFRILGGAP